MIQNGAVITQVITVNNPTSPKTTQIYTRIHTSSKKSPSPSHYNPSSNVSDFSSNKKVVYSQEEKIIISGKPQFEYTTPEATSRNFKFLDGNQPKQMKAVESDESFGHGKKKLQDLANNINIFKDNPKKKNPSQHQDSPGEEANASFISFTQSKVDEEKIKPSSSHDIINEVDYQSEENDNTNHLDQNQPTMVDSQIEEHPSSLVHEMIEDGPNQAGVPMNESVQDGNIGEDQRDSTTIPPGDEGQQPEAQELPEVAIGVKPKEENNESLEVHEHTFRGPDDQAQFDSPFRHQQNLPQSDRGENIETQSLQVPQEEQQGDSPRSDSSVGLLKSKPNLKLIMKARINLGLHSKPTLEIANHLKSNLNKEDHLTTQSFTDLLSPFKPFEIDEETYKNDLTELFHLLDSNNNGTIERSEAANVLILLGKGTKEEKIEAAFSFYDTDCNDQLNLEEMVDYFNGILRFRWRNDQGMKEMSETEVQDLAAVTGKNCFQELEVDDEGEVGYETFREYVLNKKWD